MTKDDLVAYLRDIEWEDFEVKTAKSDLPHNRYSIIPIKISTQAK